MRHRTIRLLSIAVLVLAIVAVSALVVWGTRWTVPQAASVGASYTLVTTWDGGDIPSGGLERPIGIAVSPSGDVYVTDGLQSECCVSAPVALPDPNPDIYSPEQIALSPDGKTVYATDLGRNRILVLDVKGP